LRSPVSSTLFGAQAENAAKHLRRGRQVAVDGRLEWREYEGRDNVRRQVHRIVADNVQYLLDGRRPRTADEDATDEVPS